MPIPLLAIGAGVSLANQIGKWFGGNKQVKESKKINPVFNQYQTNPYSKKQLGIAQQMFGGRMAGAPELERNIMTSQANVLDQVDRTATDASQALAAKVASQGQADQSFSDLRLAESQNKYNLLNNLNNAYGQMISEGDKEYNSMLQKYQMDATRKDALMSSGAQNKYGAVNDISSLVMQLGMMQKDGGMGRGGASVNNGMVLNTPMQRTQIGNVNNIGQVGQIPFNPAQFNQSQFVPGLYNYLNRPR